MSTKPAPQSGLTPQRARILHLEDDAKDSEIMAELLARGGVHTDIARVATREDFETLLREGGLDLIISDYTVPGYDGKAALALARELAPALPFVFFSGTMGEDVAVEMLKRGAADYVLKNRPERLVAAVLHLLGELRAKQRARELEAKFLRSQRLLGIGEVAGGIAHDLNNILAPVLMAVDLLQTGLADGETPKLLEMIRSSAQRGAELVRQILSFARGASGEIAVLDVEPLVQETVKLLRHIFPRTIEIQTHLDANLHRVRADSTQLQQVIMNLCVNARDAMPRGGRLTLHAANVLLQTRLDNSYGEGFLGPGIVLSVTDTGVGIDPELRDKIFEPFFTTKEHGRGTGLGLSTALGIIKNHGGLLEVSSALGKGTVFRIYLPACEEPSRRPGEEDPASLVGQGQLILVVDDELSVLKITKATLENYNYQVLTAQSGMEALELQRQYGQAIQAVITDLIMPVLDGRALVAELQKQNPELKVLTVSGFLTEQKTSPSDCSPGLLLKPYTKGQLLSALRELLQAPSTAAPSESGMTPSAALVVV